MQISSSSAQVDQCPRSGFVLRPLTDRKIRSKGLYFLILSQSCRPRRSRLVFVRQLRQIFCVLIKHGLRPTVPLCRSSRVRSGLDVHLHTAYRICSHYPFVAKGFASGRCLCPSPNSSTEHATNRARHNINVFTLRSIFPPWNDMQILTDIIFQYLSVKSVSAKAKEEWRNRPQGQL